MNIREIGNPVKLKGCYFHLTEKYAAVWSFWLLIKTL